MTNVTISLQLTSCSPDGEWQSGLKEHITKIIIILSFSSPLHLSLCHSSCSAWVAPLLQRCFRVECYMLQSLSTIVPIQNPPLKYTNSGT